MNAEERFKILNEFQGWGNPKNAIWFVGIEEGGSWDRKSCEEYYKMNYNNLFSEIGELDFTQDEDYFRYVDFILQKEYQPLRGKKNILFNTGEYCSAPLYRNISKICSKLFQIDEKEYNSKYLAKEKNNEIIYNSFLTNLFPLGIKNITEELWGQVLEDYRILFGHLIPDSKEAYINQIKEIRKEYIKSIISDSIPYITICHGIKYLDYFKEYFGIANLEEKKYDNFRYFISVKNKFIVTYQLSYSYNTKKFIDYLIPKISDWV